MFEKTLDLASGIIDNSAIQVEYDALCEFRDSLDGDSSGTAFDELYGEYENFLTLACDSSLYSEDAAMREIEDNMPEIPEVWRGYVDVKQYCEEQLSDWCVLEFDGYTFYCSN